MSKERGRERGSECFLYLLGSKSCNQKYDMRVDRMMESDVAKPLRMLSAYLMTAAMTRPPSAWNNKHMETDGRRHDLNGPTGSLSHKIKSLLPKRLDNTSDSFGGRCINRWQRSERYLQCHNSPGDRAVSLEHSRLLHPLSIIGHHPKEAKHQAKHPWKHRNA